MFTDLMEREETSPPLLIFESMAGWGDLDKMEWDTSLPELDEPWPHHIPEKLNLRQMVSWLTGRPDVTTYLYELHVFDEYLRTGMAPWEDDLTAVMEAVSDV